MTFYIIFQIKVIYILFYYFFLLPSAHVWKDNILLGYCQGGEGKAVYGHIRNIIFHKQL